jgi:hypothetical protein
MYYFMEIKYFKNSIYNINIIFDRIHLTSITIRYLRIQIKNIFGKYIPGDYISVSADINIYLLFIILLDKKLAYPRVIINIRFVD